MPPFTFDVSALTGQLFVVGFDGHALPEDVREGLAKGQLGGVILFKRNLPTVEAAREINAAASQAAPADLPPFIAVDQEGGRVTRLPPPALSLPPMRALASRGDLALTFRAAEAVGAELRALGFNINFAPVLDVNTCEKNPIIGDRAFGHEPGVVADHGVAFLRGLQSAGVMACGKHFPGHGDTSLDSHLDLPVVTRDAGSLRAVELVPFAAAIRAGVDAIMTAHVVYPALDPQKPATLSAPILTDLLRRELGFEGVVFSDDLEMKAVADRTSVGEAAVSALLAGCDTLLVCRDRQQHAEAHGALTREAERSPAFRQRCEAALARNLAARRRRPPVALPSAEALSRWFRTAPATALRNVLG